MSGVWCQNCKMFINPLEKTGIVTSTYNPLTFILANEMGLGEEYNAAFLYKKFGNRNKLLDYKCPKCGKTNLSFKEPMESVKREYDPKTTSGRNYWGGFDESMKYNDLKTLEVKTMISRVKNNRISSGFPQKVYKNKFYRTGFLEGLENIYKMKYQEDMKKTPTRKITTL